MNQAFRRCTNGRFLFYLTGATLTSLFTVFSAANAPQAIIKVSASPIIANFFIVFLLIKNSITILLPVEKPCIFQSESISCPISNIYERLYFVKEKIAKLEKFHRSLRDKKEKMFSMLARVNFSFFIIFFTGFLTDYPHWFNGYLLKQYY